MAVPSEFDNQTGITARNHINQFIKKVSFSYNHIVGRLLEVGPQDRSFIKNMFPNLEYFDLDINDKYNPRIVGDLTKENQDIPSNYFDIIFCMEVLEHSLNPFNVVKELRRILKNQGLLVVSAPLNWRIHGPIPDCWRFTEHGFKVLLKDFDIIEIDILETPGRELFPIHYNVLAVNNLSKVANDSEIKFRVI